MKVLKDRYKLEMMDMLNDELLFLLKDLETNEYVEITEATLKNKCSKTDLIIYKLVMDYMYNNLVNKKGRTLK